MEYPIYGHLDNDLVEEVGGKLVLKKATTDKIEAQSDKDLPTSKTSGDISFDVPYIFGSSTTPYTTDLTHDLTGAVLGIVQKIYSTKSVEPTYPAGWVKIGTGTYTGGALNIIYAEFCGGTRVEYWIVAGE